MSGKQGFASMSPEDRKRIASIGGKRAHALGRGHTFTREEAQAAGRKGAAKNLENRRHLLQIVEEEVLEVLDAPLRLTEIVKRLNMIERSSWCPYSGTGPVPNASTGRLWGVLRRLLRDRKVRYVSYGTYQRLVTPKELRDGRGQTDAREVNGYGTCYDQGADRGAGDAAKSPGSGVRSQGAAAGSSSPAGG